MRSLAFLLPVVLLIVITSVLRADVIHIPADSLTIQAGINGTVDGDTVMVSPGIYHEYNIDFLGKSIVVTSTDPLDSSIVAATIVDADSLGHVFYFHHEEDSLSILTGLTMTGGFTDTTGGVSCFSSAPTIVHNIITGNRAGTGGFGAGISCRSSASIIAHNIIVDNAIEDDGFGGGISCESSTITIDDNVISDNAVDRDGCGGGISCLFSSPTITRNIISDNFASKTGGGIYCQESSAVIMENSIINNRGGYWTGYWGGGIACRNASWVLIHSNTIIGNKSSRGGGISCELEASGLIAHNLIAENEAWLGGGIDFHDHVSLRIANNAIVGNLAYTGGGAVACNVECSSVLTGNTIAWNTAEKHGGGINPYASSHMVVSSTILWGNNAPEGPEMSIGSEDDSSSVSIDFSDVQGGQDDVRILSRSTLDWGQGMIDAAPLFVDPENGDLSLRTDSPCIDSGDPASEIPPNGGDRVDMGAFEYEYPQSSPLHLTFENTPTTGARGDTVVWDFTIENLDADPVVFDGWISVSGPNNSVRDSILDVTVPPGSVIPGNAYLYIPFGAPLGLYTAKGRVGIMHAEIWDGEVFNGVVVEGNRSMIKKQDRDNWIMKIELLGSNPIPWQSNRLLNGRP